MASEIQARLDADGGAGLVDNTGVVPGSGGDPPAPVAPPAGESNTDTATGGQVPDTIPYARFKEVNDRYNDLKGFETLKEYGYDSDSLSRLAAFEAQYLQAPIETWRTMADNLDLPQEVKDAIDAHLASGRAEGAPPANDPKPPELSPEVKERLDYVDQLRAREQEREQQASLQRVVAAWDELDKADNVKTTERVKLMAIAAVARDGQTYSTVEDFAKAAREPTLEYRNEILGDAIQRTGRGGSPPALPGSAPVPSGAVHFKTIREASKAAEEAIKRGELPTLDMGA
jgi:hypothetical protein